MSKNLRLPALTAALVLLLSACAPGGKDSDVRPDGPLTCSTWNGYDLFWDLAADVCPDIELELSPYSGGNRTGYSWAQMRGDDIPDIFITSQILDGELARERLADLSGYDFVNDLSTSILDQVSIDGGIYLLPVSNTMHGIFYNKTLMEEHGWQLPSNFDELEQLCADIRQAGLIPGVIGTQLTGNTFSALFNLAKTDWLTTPEGINWERDFLAGRATAAGMWEDTADYAQQYLDAGMFHTDPEDRNNPTVMLDWMDNRKCVFFTGVMTVNITQLPNTGDQLGIMPYISRDGGKNVYMYSPSSYIGISKRLTQPGNEKKLEQAIRLLSLLYSPEGQQTFITDETPCVLSVLSSTPVSENSLVYDAQQALREGRAFPMTYAGWENVLTDIGQGIKEWFRGENGMDGPKCIARMDELQSAYLDSRQDIYFCESTGDFTVEETACLVGKALGSAAGADAAVVPFTTVRKEGSDLRAGVTARLYQGRINADVANTLSPGLSGEYAVMTMTGAQLKELAAAGFDAAGDGAPFPYALVVRGGGEPEDGKTYQVAFLQNSYTDETAQTFQPQIEKGSIGAFLRNWLAEQKTVSPGGNPWE